MGQLTAIPKTREQLFELSYKELQHLSKSLGLKANAKKEVLQSLCWTTIRDLCNDTSSGSDVPLSDRSLSPLKQKQGFAARTRDVLARVACRMTGSSRTRGSHYVADETAALQDTTNQVHNISKPQAIEVGMEKLSMADDTAAAPDAGTHHVQPPLNAKLLPLHSKHSPLESSLHPASPNAENRPSPRPEAHLAAASPQRLASPAAAAVRPAASPSPPRLSPVRTDAAELPFEVMFFPISPKHSAPAAPPAFASPAAHSRGSPAPSPHDRSLASSVSPKPSPLPRRPLAIPPLPLATLNAPAATPHSPSTTSLSSTPHSGRARPPAPSPPPAIRTSTTGALPAARRTAQAPSSLRTSTARGPTTKPLRTSFSSAPTRSSTPPTLRPGAALPDKTRPTLSKPHAPPAASRASLAAAAKASRLTSSTTTAPKPTTPRSALRTSATVSRPAASSAPAPPKPTTPRHTPAAAAAAASKAAALRSSLRTSAAAPFSPFAARPTTPRQRATTPTAKPTTPRALHTSISGPVPTPRATRPNLAAAPATKPTTPSALRTSTAGSLSTRPKPTTMTAAAAKPSNAAVASKQAPCKQPLHTTTATTAAAPSKPWSTATATAAPTVKPGAFLLAHRGSIFPSSPHTAAAPTSAAKLKCLRTAPTPSTASHPSNPSTAPRSPRPTTPTTTTTGSGLPFSFAPNAPPCTPPSTVPRRHSPPGTTSGVVTTPMRIPPDLQHRRLVETLAELEALSLSQQQYGYAIPQPRAPPQQQQQQRPQQQPQVTTPRQEPQATTPLRPKALKLEGAPVSHTPTLTPRRLPVANYLPEQELQRLDSLAHSFILCDPTPVGWRDVCGQDDLKRRLEQLATSVEGKAFEKLPRCRTRTALMFGLPGTGKSMLAHALATELGAGMWEVTAAALARSREAPERLLRATFQAAARRPLSIVLLERLDELLEGRDGSKQLFDQGQTSRIRAELMAQLDLCDDGARCSPRRPGVLVLALSSRPQALGDELVALFGCRVYVPLPGVEAREMLLFQLLVHEDAAMNADDLHRIVRRTSGFSCNDVMHVCQYAITSARPQLRASQVAQQQSSVTLAHFNNALKDPRLREKFTSTDAQLEMERWFWQHGKA